MECKQTANIIHKKILNYSYYYYLRLILVSVMINDSNYNGNTYKQNTRSVH